MIFCYHMPTDLLVSESSIPLSPQWLYAKPSDTKMVGTYFTWAIITSWLDLMICILMGTIKVSYGFEAERFKLLSFLPPGEYDNIQNIW